MCILEHVYKCMYVCMSADEYEYESVHVFVSVYVYTSAYICMSIYVCISV